MIRKYLSENKTDIAVAIPGVVFLNIISDVIFPGSSAVVLLTVTTMTTTCAIYNFIRENVI